MKYFNKVAELAESFAHKYAQTPSTEQSGTTELFFDNVNKQEAFARAIQNQGGAVFQALLSAFNKAGGKTPFSFDLKINAVPKKGASWILKTNPPTFQTAASVALDTEYQKIMGQSMKARLASADAKAKAGAGSGGPLDVGALDLAP